MRAITATSSDCIQVGVTDFEQYLYILKSMILYDRIALCAGFIANLTEKCKQT